MEWRYDLPEEHLWCDFRYNTALADAYYNGQEGGGKRFACRRLSGHDDEHWCPGQQDVEEQMTYLKQSLGITESETT